MPPKIIKQAKQMDSHAQGSFSVPALGSLAVPDVLGPKWVPRGQRQLDLLAQGTLRLYNYGPRGGGGGGGVGGDRHPREIPAHEWQR